MVKTKEIDARKYNRAVAEILAKLGHDKVATEVRIEPISLYEIWRDRAVPEFYFRQVAQEQRVAIPRHDRRFLCELIAGDEKTLMETSQLGEGTLKARAQSYNLRDSSSSGEGRVPCRVGAIRLNSNRE